MNRTARLRNLASFALWIFAALTFRSVVASAYVIPSGSMIPTLQVGDRILVEKLSLGLNVPLPLFEAKLGAQSPDRGDVVVFAQPATDKVLIKRVVAVAGDRVELAAGQLQINGAEQTHTALGPVREQDYDEANGRFYEQSYKAWADSLGPRRFTTLSMRAGGNYGPVTVPPGHVFVLGDNRDNSSDSRYWGFVPIERIHGRARRVIWSTGPAGLRWSRFFQRIN